MLPGSIPGTAAGSSVASDSLSRESPASSNEAIHDYAEIYTPSREGNAWTTAQTADQQNQNQPQQQQQEVVVGTPRPPTPPLHRFPSWEAKIYQVFFVFFN